MKVNFSLITEVNSQAIFMKFGKKLFYSHLASILKIYFKKMLYGSDMIVVNFWNFTGISIKFQGCCQLTW